MTDSQDPEPTLEYKWKVFNAFIAEIRDETDRAAVILGVAKLDSILYQILKASLHPSPNRDDELLDGDAALSTFSARIALLHRMNVISAGFARALHLVRKIRNAFAHEVAGCRLDSGSQHDRVRELFLPLKALDVVHVAKTNEFRGQSGPGVDFRITLALLVARLEQVLDESKPVGSDEPWNFPPKAWQDPVEPPKQSGPA